MPYANNKGAEFQESQLVSSPEQAGLSLTWLQIPKTGFLATWLILEESICHFRNI